MVDAADLKSAGRKAVGVRVPSWAPGSYGFFKAFTPVFAMPQICPFSGFSGIFFGNFCHLFFRPEKTWQIFV